MKITRRFRCAAIGAMVGTLVVSPFLTMLLDRREVLTLDVSASRIHPNPARNGETIDVVWTANPRRNCAGVVIPRVIDSSGRIFEYSRLPTVYQDLLKPGDRTFTKTLTLPTSMAPGTARYQAIVIRWCNIVQEYLWPMIEAPFPIFFEVIP